MSSRPQLPTAEPSYDPNRPFPDILLLYSHSIPNFPGKTIVALQVTFPPNGSTPPHTHAGAFVSVNVVSGYVFNKMNDNPMEVFGPGESFKEHPGCRHRISDNASTTEPARIVATMIVDTKVVDDGGIQGLVIIDEEYREMVEAKQKEAGMKS
ncbi:hypothetical protein BJ875DRAFT_477206 [Amylocarpus encephaloides]|uniref:Cupin type-2 domain-containing protein n=1 Tax=Amylocarpus encephaloides TaxID=45428 RepID=A0A9P7Y8S0_9HELO|nr:hypothetical protein BJ875DRAFT_477206 [Amylocarpus encephaloides]